MISESRAFVYTQQHSEHVFESLLFSVGEFGETLVKSLTGFVELRGGYFG